MATYVPIIDTQVDPDAPLTSALAYQFRDNPTAVWEGDDSAPAIDEGAYSSVFGSYTLNNTYQTINNIKKTDAIAIRGFVNDGGAATIFQLRFSSDNGSTWSAATDINAVAGMSFYVWVDLVAGMVQRLNSDNTGALDDLTISTIAAAAGADAISFRVGVTDTGTAVVSRT